MNRSIVASDPSQKTLFCVPGSAKRCIGVSIPLISIKWFMCLYVNLLPAAVARQVWDNFFWFGPRVLFEVGLELLRRCEPQLR